MTISCFPVNQGQKIQEAFHVEDSKVSEGSFLVFCGREISQEEDGSITATCKSTAENIEPISYRTGVRKTELANDAEKSQLRSVVGSLACVARQARPDLSYRANKLQSVSPEILCLRTRQSQTRRSFETKGLLTRQEC